MEYYVHWYSIQKPRRDKRMKKRYVLSMVGMSEGGSDVGGPRIGMLVGGLLRVWRRLTDR
jgi:hypothetical protein